MPKADSRMDDARRQGQFEGQVLTSLVDIKKGMDAFNSNFVSLEGRVRTNEKTLGNHDQKFIDSEEAHKEMFKQIGELAKIVASLVQYQDKMRGVILAVLVVMPVVTTIIAAIILQAARAWFAVN